MNEEISSVLIILMGSLGDVARGLSVAEALKNKNPAIRITWLVEKKCEELVRLAQSVDEVICFNRNFNGLLDTVKELRRRHFDVTLDMQRHFKSGVLSYLSGCSRRIGVHRMDGKEGNWLFNTETVRPVGNKVNKINLYYAFLEQVKIPPPKTPIVKLKGISSPLLKTKNAFLVMGSSWRSKNWVGEGYQKLISDLLSDYDYLTLVGGKEEYETSELLSKRFGQDRVINRCGQTSLFELCSIISRSRIGIGPDSGPGHLASALGIPYVSLFGPTSPKRVSPVGSEHLVVRSQIGCSPCYRRECPGLDRLCMRLLSIPRIIEKVRLSQRGTP